MTDAAKRVSAFWGVERPTERPAHWLTHPVTRAFIHRRISGDPAVGSVDWFQQTFLPDRRVERMLSLGCGFGALERHAATSELAREIDAVDISVEAVARAGELALAAGLADRIHYRVADLNCLALPAQSYDLIAATSAVHHVEALERLFETCARALRPGGLIFLDEYVGPSRFQTGAHEQTIINWLLKSLPAHRRRNLFGANPPTIDVYAPASAAWFAENDPSEAVRSAEIRPCLEHAFEIIAFRPYGGAIMHHLLSGIAGNFDEEVELDRAFLEGLAAVEEALEKEGAIASDFAVLVARPRRLRARRNFLRFP